MDDNRINFNYALDSQGARLERSNKRLFILNVILLIILLATNGAWIYHESQFVDEINLKQEVDTGDGDAYVNGIGDVNYGEGKTNNK